jgi:hypothetical protein
LWFQWDYADGPLVEKRKTWLWCAWLAWSKYRVVLPIRDKTLPTVIACLDVTLRRFGGVPTYGLSDNEKTLTLDHIARIAVRHPTMAEVARWYGLTLASCVPADPQSKGGSEATVRIASADLVPTEANLLPDYSSFIQYRRDCDAFCERVNARPHSATRCPPIERLAQEHERLHPLPSEPFTAAFGVTRGVGENLPVIHFEGGEYSVPDDYVGKEVWVRQQDDEIIIVPELQAAVASELLPLGKAMKLTSAPREHLAELIQEASSLTQPEIVARVTALRREPNMRAVRTASLNEGRAMDALRILNRIDAVDDAGPVPDLLVLILQRVNELLALPGSGDHLPKANRTKGTTTSTQPLARRSKRRTRAV